MLERLSLPLLLILPAGAVVQAQNIEVLYTKIDASSTSDIPGTLDLLGQPAASKWRALEDFTVSHDGSEWVLKGRTRLGSDLETILVRGHGDTGTQFAENMAQEGQPIPGEAPGVLWDFFDSLSPVSYDSRNNIGMSARSKGPPTGQQERILKRDCAGNWTVVLREGDPLIGLTDTPVANAGDEALGNSVSGVHLLDDGRIGYVVTPIQNCSSFNYPAFLYDDQGFLQTGSSMLNTGEIWDSMDLGDAGGTPDGSSYWIQGDTEEPNTAIDDVFTVNNVVVLREGSPVASGGLIYVDTFQAQMAASGDWVARGDDPNNDDWAVHNGNLIAQTGSSVEGGAELWGSSFLAVACNSVGDWALIGTTDNPDASLDTVLVVNGVVIAREGDPVDLDGNGFFDDGAFLGDGTPTSSAFAANDLAITDCGLVYFIANLNDGLGNDLNDAGFGSPEGFMRVQVNTTPPPVAFCFGDGNCNSTACPCAAQGDSGKGCPNSGSSGGALLTYSGSTSVLAGDLILHASGMPATVPSLCFQGDGLVTTPGAPPLSGAAFGDGVRCAGGALKRMEVKFNVGGASQYPEFGDLSIPVKGNLPAGGGVTRYYQCWFRDNSGCTGAGFNVSNALKVVWTP
jgi:hypothetical protein